MFKKSEVKVLKYLYDQKVEVSPTTIFRETGLAYNGVFLTVQALEEMGLVTSRIWRKFRMISLTEKGRKVVELLKKIEGIIDK